MEQEVEAGSFREDLYFRLNVITIQIPNLADRPDDIEPLANFFAEKYAAANGLDGMQVSEETLIYLQNHPWPGTVRELENTIHRGVLLAVGNEIKPESIHLRGSGSSHGAAAKPNGATVGGINLVGKTVAEVEQGLIIDTLDHCLGNRTHAANILGISIRTLRNKLKQYSAQGVTVPAPGEGGTKAPV